MSQFLAPGNRTPQRHHVHSKTWQPHPSGRQYHYQNTFAVSVLGLNLSAKSLVDKTSSSEMSSLSLPTWFFERMMKRNLCFLWSFRYFQIVVIIKESKEWNWFTQKTVILPNFSPSFAILLLVELPHLVLQCALFSCWSTPFLNLSSDSWYVFIFRHVIQLHTSLYLSLIFVLDQIMVKLSNRDNSQLIFLYGQLW